MAQLERPPRGSGGSAPSGASPGYETRDVPVRPIVVGALVGTLAIAGFFVLMWWMFLAITTRDAASSAPSHPLARRGADNRPPEPRLQTDPRRELAELHAREDEILKSYAWIDRERGIVRVPIDRAMELYLERDAGGAR